MRLPYSALLACIGCTLLCLLSCGRQPSAYRYCSTPVEGWEPGDTLKIHIDTLASSGTYTLSVGLRTSASTPYPFRSLWIVIRQHWHNPERIVNDTLECRLTNEKGDVTGHGVSLYQYDQPWKEVTLERGTSADLSITHYMRSEMVRGIADVGIKMVRK